MKRIMNIILAAALLFSLTACGASEPAVEPSQSPATPQQTAAHTPTAEEYIAPTVEETGEIYARTALALPEENAIIFHQAKFGDSVYMYSAVALYKLNLADNSVETIELPGDIRISDLSVSADGELNLLSITEQEEFVFHSLGADNTWQSMTMPMLDEYRNSSIVQIFKLEKGLLVFTSAEILALDHEGRLIKNLGKYYRLGTCLPREDGSLVVITQAMPDMAAQSPVTRTRVIDADFNIAESYDSNSQFSSFYADCSTDGNTVLAHNVNTLYRFDYKNDTKQALVNTSSSGMNPNSLLCLADGLYLASDNRGPALWKPYDGETPRELTLATYYLDWDVDKLVKAYNESGAKYRIVIMDYAMYDEAGQEGQGLSRLQADIIAGRAPDIYDLSQLPAQLYAERGGFEDLKPYFSGDAPIQYEDFVQSVIKALEYDGGLYYFAPYYIVNTVCGNESFVGSGDTWTPEDFFTAVEGMAPVDVFGPETTQRDFLKHLLVFLGKEYIDIDSLECHFDDADFERFLEFAAQLPAECDYSSLDSQANARAYMGVQPVMLTQIGIYAMKTMSYNDVSFGGKAQYVGFPTNSSSGVALSPLALMAMSVSSLCKEGVMDFIYFTQSEAGQRYNMYCPILQSQLDECMNSWEAQYTQYEPGLRTFYDGATVIIEGKTDIEHAKQRIIKSIDSIDCVELVDDALLEILMRECQPLFAGDISAKQAAAAIQSKVSIYLAEQYG